MLTDSVVIDVEVLLWYICESILATIVFLVIIFLLKPSKLLNNKDNNIVLTSEGLPRIFEICIGFYNVYRMVTNTVGFMESIEKKYSGNELKIVQFPLMLDKQYLVVKPKDIKSLYKHEWKSTFEDNVNVQTIFGKKLINSLNEQEWFEGRKRYYIKHLHSKALIKQNDIVINIFEQNYLSIINDAAINKESINMYNIILEIAARVAFIFFIGDENKETPDEIYKSLNQIFTYFRKHVFDIPPTFIKWALFKSDPEHQNYFAQRDKLRNYCQQRLNRAEEDNELFLKSAYEFHNSNIDISDKKKEEIEKYLLDEIVAILLAASETTVNFMTWALIHLALHEDCQNKLIEEIDQVIGKETPNLNHFKKMPYLNAVLNETLRLKSPTMAIIRKAEKDTNINGVYIPKNSTCYAINKISQCHPKLYEQSFEFNPQRWLLNNEKPFVFSFSGGRHECLGKYFAMQECMVVVTCILQKFKIISSPDYDLHHIKEDICGTVRPDRPVMIQPLLR